MRRLPRTDRRAGPKRTFMVGGDEADQYNCICENVREQVIWAATDDPWAEPGSRPPTATLYLQNEELVEAERKRFLEFFDIQDDKAIMGLDGHFSLLPTRLLWEGWLGARLGFKRDDY